MKKKIEIAACQFTILRLRIMLLASCECNQATPKLDDCIWCEVATKTVSRFITCNSIAIADVVNNSLMVMIWVLTELFSISRVFRSLHCPLPRRIFFGFEALERTRNQLMVLDDVKFFVRESPSSTLVIDGAECLYPNPQTKITFSVANVFPRKGRGWHFVALFSDEVENGCCWWRYGHCRQKKISESFEINMRSILTETTRHIGSKIFSCLRISLLAFCYGGGWSEPFLGW